MQGDLGHPADRVGEAQHRQDDQHHQLDRQEGAGDDRVGANVEDAQQGREATTTPRAISRAGAPGQMTAR